MWSGSAIPGASTVWSGKSGICIVGRSLPAFAGASFRAPGAVSLRGEQQRRRYAGGVGVADPWRAMARGERQWAQERAEPASSAVRKLEPQPQPDTAFGLFTVKPAPISVST